MRIANAIIKEVEVIFNDSDDLVARVIFTDAIGDIYWSFKLKKLNDVKRLEALMRYTNSKELLEIKGKIVRVCIDGDVLKGFADLIKDIYFPIYTRTFNEFHFEANTNFIEKEKVKSN